MKDQVVIIIGGSSGIGLSTAELALKEGAQVTITGLHEESTAKALKQLPGARGKALDVLSEEGIDSFLSKYETIDHIYVAAGSTKLGGILEGGVDEQMIPINLRLIGSVYLIRAAMPKMNNGGSIIFTGGLSTDRPVAGAWVSGIGTAVTEQLARVMALELAPIRFNAISPGWTNTPMWDKVLGENKESVLEEVADSMLIDRIVEADEVANAVVFLMKNQAITGEVLHVDGGGRLV